MHAPLKYTFAFALVVWKSVGCGEPVRFQLFAVPVIVSVDGTDKFSAVMSAVLFNIGPVPPDDIVPVTLLEATARLNVPPAASLMFSNEVQLKAPLFPAF